MIEVLRQAGIFPHTCVWELTLLCNLRCKHCGSVAGRRRVDELSLDECRRVAGELVDLGCRHITLIGGEPTLYPGWDAVGRRLVELGALVNMISNGLTWSESHVEQAKAAGFCAVSFSVDGFEKEHDAFRAPGSWQRVMRAIDVTVAGGLRAGVNTTITRLNREQLPDLRRFLMEHGVFGWQVQLATAAGSMGEHRDLLLPPEDLLWLVPQIADLCRIPCPEFQIYVGHNIGYFGKPEAALRAEDAALPFWLGCRAGCHVIGIESGGDVKGCLSLPSSVHGESRFVEGNVREKSLREIWTRPGAFAYNRLFKVEQLAGFCRVCRFRDVCRGGCSWGAWAQGGAENEYCFYHQAVKHGRCDLLGEEPTAEETCYFAAHGPIHHTSTPPGESPPLPPAPGPPDPPALHLRLEAARHAATQGDLPRAEQLLEEILSEDEACLLALDLLGFVRYFLGRPGEAEEACRRALAIDPNRAYANKGLGLCLAKQGQVDQGLLYLRRAIALDPRWFDPRWDLTIVLTEAARYDEALSTLGAAELAIPEEGERCARLRQEILTRARQADSAK